MLHANMKSMPWTCAAVTVCLLLPASTAHAQADKRLQAFQENWEQAERAHQAKDYASAKPYYEKVFEFIPYEPSSRYQYARCLAMLGDVDGSIRELTKAIEYGFNDPEAIAVQEPELAALREDPRLKDIVRAARECRSEKLALYKGVGVKEDKPAPLLVVLHGLAEHPRVQLAYWKETADRSGLILVAPYGPRRMGQMSYAWHRQGGRETDMDMTAAWRLIKKAIGVAKRKHRVDEDQIVLAGFSQGGALALHCLSDPPVPVRGAIAFCPAYQSTGTSATESDHLKAYVIVGGLDEHWLAGGRQANTDLRASGIAVEYIEVPDMGHDFPRNLLEHQQKALKFVLDR